MFSSESHLIERCRWVDCEKDLSTLRTDGFIVYWMRYALRAEENPALDVAITIASIHGCQLLVYQELNCQDEYSSDRHHTFALEGAADVQAQLAAKGISYAFHLAPNKAESSPLTSLARQAELVIAEEMPTTIARKELDLLNDSVETSLLCVDASCVLPMQLSDNAFTRAFEYRNATKNEYKKRIESDWWLYGEEIIKEKGADLLLGAVGCHKELLISNTNVVVGTSVVIVSDCPLI